MRVRISAFMFVVLLAVAAPMASAQSQAVQRMNVALQGFVDDPLLPNNRILPETGVAKVRVEALLTVDMYNRAASCSTPVQVDFTVRAPSYATAVMVPSTQSILVPGPSTPNGGQSAWQSFPFAAVLEITVGRDAPAFVDGLYEVIMQARSQANSQSYSSACDLGTSALSLGVYRLKNDFTPRTSIGAAELFAKAGPNEKVVFPITVTNVGNGPTRVTVSLRPGDGAAFRAYSVGPEVRLAGPIVTGGESPSKTIPVAVTTPATWGYANRFSTMTATVTSTYDGVAPGTTFQESSEITFTVQTQGLYLGLSSVVGLPLVLVGAVLVGAFVMKSIPAVGTRWRAARKEAARVHIKEEKAHEGVKAAKAAEAQVVREAKEGAKAAKAAEAEAVREAKEGAKAAKAAEAEAARDARQAAKGKQEGDGYAPWGHPDGRRPEDEKNPRRP